MAVDSDVPSTSAATPAAPVLSAAAIKKEEEAKAERERKYPGPKRAGIVLAGEKKVSSKLLEKDLGSREKVFKINGLVRFIHWRKDRADELLMDTETPSLLLRVFRQMQTRWLAMREMLRRSVNFEHSHLS